MKIEVSLIKLIKVAFQKYHNHLIGRQGKSTFNIEVL